jgi:endonuclease YncB( thermonuclease family)
MTAGPRVTGTLTRVEPPAKPAEARTERLFSPIVVAAGTIRARDRDIHLAGIAAPEFEARCGEEAKAWPCGRMARAALRSFIRGRAIECTIPAGADAIPDPAQCQVGGDDISEWLIAQGWAKRSGEAFEAAEKKAQDAKLGLWGDGRPDAQPEVAASG